MAEEQQIEQQSVPKSLAFAKRGVTTGRDFANMMSAIMSDLLEGTLSPQVGNAVCNVGGKLLKVVEMEQRYSNPPRIVDDNPGLVLAPGSKVLDESI